MDCGAVKVDRATTPSSTGTPRATEIVLWASAIGALSLAAVVNQVAITLCRRGQAAIDTSLRIHESVLVLMRFGGGLRTPAQGDAI